MLVGIWLVLVVCELLAVVAPLPVAVLFLLPDWLDESPVSEAAADPDADAAAEPEAEAAAVADADADAG